MMHRAPPADPYMEFLRAKAAVVVASGMPEVPALPSALKPFQAANRRQHRHVTEAGAKRSAGVRDQTDDELTAEARRTADPPSRSVDQHKSIMIWQRYAEQIWTDINQGDTLSFRLAREEHDERHISPLQLTPVRRCIDLWSNPGDVVFSPFAGIGTAGYCAIERPCFTSHTQSAG